MPRRDRSACQGRALSAATVVTAALLLLAMMPAQALAAPSGVAGQASPPLRSPATSALESSGVWESALTAPLAAQAADSSRVASAWGYNGDGQLGDGHEGYEYDSGVPVEVSGLSGVVAVGGGWHDSVALLEDGTVWAWGANGRGQLGDGSTFPSDVPVQAIGLNGVSAISAGGGHNLALLSDGTVAAWGLNNNGQLGNGTASEGVNDVPAAVHGLSGVMAIAAGGYHSLALLEDGTVMAWGEGGSGELGDGTTSSSDVPVPVSGLSEVVAIAAGEYSSLALRRDGTVVAWGDDGFGQLGDGRPFGEYSDVPIPVCAPGEKAPCAQHLRDVAAIAMGMSHSLALLDNGTVLAWGFNSFGQLGDGTRETRRAPVPVSGLGEVTALAAGCYHSLALLGDGTVSAWGRNSEGELGDLHAGKESAVPVTVEGLGGATAIGAGCEHSLAASAPPLPVPQIKNVEPHSGPSTGGTSVTITGVDLSAATDVKFGARSAASFTVDSETSITAVSPSGAGAVDVTAEVAGGTTATSASDRFGYVPAVSSVAPSVGRPAGGTVVTITGSAFAEVTAVRFGHTNAASYVVDSESQITAVSPASAGTAEVTVETAGGTSPHVPGDHFSYVPHAIIDGVAPFHGPPSGGTEVTITGANFYEVTAVKFGKVEAASFEVESEHTITAVSPPFAGGHDDAVWIYVKTREGTNDPEAERGSTEQAGFIYEPTIAKVTPSSGSVAGGAAVSITGQAFQGRVIYETEFAEAVVHGVYFGTNPATEVAVLSPSQITAVAPPGTATGTVDVTVTSVVGPSPITPGDQFSYLPPPPPSVMKLTPKKGPAAGETAVIVTGTGFTGATAVDFGSTSAAGFEVTSPTSLAAIAPPGSVGTVDLTVTTPNGTSALTRKDHFKYRKS